MKFKRIGYEKAKKAKEMLKQGFTYDEVQEATGLSRSTIAAIAKASDEEIEKVRELEERKVAKKEGEYMKKANKLLLKEIQEMVSKRALENVRNLLNYGLFVEGLYLGKGREFFENLVAGLINERFKNELLTILVLKLLRGEIDKEEFIRKYLVIKYA